MPTVSCKIVRIIYPPNQIIIEKINLEQQVHEIIHENYLYSNCNNAIKIFWKIKLFTNKSISLKGQNHHQVIRNNYAD